MPIVMPVAESGLPGGGPSDRGISLDPSIPGASTFAKPVDDTREFDKSAPGSLYRKDGPDGLNKEQDSPSGDRRQNEWLTPSYAKPGGQPKDDKTITKYPYRDGIPNQHNAASDVGVIQNVVNLWLLKTAHELVISLEGQLKVAVKLSEVEFGLNPRVIDRSRKCAVSLKRADIPNLRWIFSVDAGNGPKLVRLKAVRKGNTTALAKMDVVLSCSCQAWRWLGSEYHAKRENYLEGKPVGTASTPDIKDPTRINRVCKHVAAVIRQVKTWTVPVKKPTSK